MNHTAKYLIFFLLFTIIFSCQQAQKKPESIIVKQKTKPITKPKETERPDTCGVIFSEFKYPEDLENMRNRGYVCTDSSYLKKIPRIRKIDHSIFFQDKNYLLLRILPTPGICFACLLWDKRKDKLISFKTGYKFAIFTAKEIREIYYLNKKLIPVHFISNWGPGRKISFGSLVLPESEKRSFEARQVVTNINMQKAFFPPLEQMSYSDLLKFDSLVNANAYTVEKQEFGSSINAWYR